HWGWLPQHVLRDSADTLRRSRISPNRLDALRTDDVQSGLRSFRRTKARQRNIGVPARHGDPYAVLRTRHPGVTGRAGHQGVATDEKELESLLRDSKRGALGFLV